jgi:voltage-gated potassium channel
MPRLTEFLREFFYGHGALSARGRFLLLGVDIAIVLYFVVTTFLPFARWIVIADFVIGLYLATELTARVIAHEDRIGFLTRPMVLLDIAIIASLFLPTVIGNFAFLRVVRALRLLRTYAVRSSLRHHFRVFARNEEVVFSALNLLVFIFVITAFVFVLQEGRNEQIGNYIDALYFTITTLTTTGFGDIILEGSVGRLLAIIIMVVGVSLFLRLVQTIFRPTKIRHECSRCGLTRHDLDAVHCKHCGHELHIRTEGLY